MLKVRDKVQFMPNRFEAWSYGDTVSNGFIDKGELTEDEFNDFLEWSEHPQFGTVMSIQLDHGKWGEEVVEVVIELDHGFRAFTTYVIPLLSRKELDEFKVL